MNLFEKESWRLSTTKNEYYHLEYVGILGSKLVYLKVLLFPILFTADNCLLEEKWVLETKIGTENVRQRTATNERR